MVGQRNQIHLETHTFDVCVIGGGMAGLCAAIAAARHGARTALIHDRPVLGGNASSEIRMWICGAHGDHNKEAGILEEIQLENLARNPSLNWSIWDSVLYGKAFCQPNLTTFLNASVLDADTVDDRIVSVEAWQLTTQTRLRFEAKYFIDCSGDSILAPLTGAKSRWGREARDEFDEDIQPDEPDGKTMGNSLLIQTHYTESPQPFVPPPWAYQFDSPEDLPARLRGINGHNFWWIEVGGLNDTIADSERISEELHRVVWGVWDYIKNRAPEREQAENWAIHWIGSLPGKRENRRYVGDHILTQNDVRAEGRFDDVVAHGGWTMDDHHPAGIYYPGKPTIHHSAPSPFGIPYRCLYSRNIENLLFAGRNISVTHAALSATRVMATCAVLGQAAGTAAALCIQHGLKPASFSSGERLADLRNTLMDDDQWLPFSTRQVDPLAQTAQFHAPGDSAGNLLDGHERDRPDASHAWVGQPGDTIEYTWDQPTHVGGLRIVFDSDLSHGKKMACAYPIRGDRNALPDCLVKAYQVDVRDEQGQWHVHHRDESNCRRLVRLALNRNVTGVRLVPQAAHGQGDVRVFGFEPTTKAPSVVLDEPRRRQFSERVAEIDPADLAPPASTLSESPTHRTQSA